VERGTYETKTTLWQSEIRKKKKVLSRLFTPY